MKRKFFSLLALAIVFSAVGFAQGVHAGVKGGVNLFKMDGKSFQEEFHHSYNAGFFGEIYFTKKIGIQPELLWNQADARPSKRFHDIYDDGLGELKNVKLNYLSIPLLFNFRPTKLVTFQAGPQYGILINKQETLLANGKNAFKTGDLSMLGGVQVNIKNVRVGGRYTVGLTNINDIDNRDKWRNQGFQLYVGVKII